jgi:nucleoid DNA-binding protein
VTKKEIVKQIAEKVEETQLKIKEIVQLTFKAIVDTLLEEKRIELRNFGVFEVKQRKARKARNPRTGDRVDVPPKNVVTFKPGKEMEELVRNLTDVPAMEDEDGSEGNGEAAEHAEDGAARAGARPKRVRKPT